MSCSCTGRDTEAAGCDFWNLPTSDGKICRIPFDVEIHMDYSKKIYICILESYLSQKYFIYIYMYIDINTEIQIVFASINKYKDMLEDSNWEWFS